MKKRKLIMPLSHSRYERQKAIETILYFAEQTNDVRRIYNLIYWADKKRFMLSGQSLYGERYLATAEGIIPQHSYNLIQDGEAKNVSNPQRVALQQCFLVEDEQIKPLRPADCDFFSQNDLTCLEATWQEMVTTSPQDFLTRAKAEKSYQKTPLNKPISWQDWILLDMPNGKDIWEYLNL